MKGNKDNYKAEKPSSKKPVLPKNHTVTPNWGDPKSVKVVKGK